MKKNKLLVLIGCFLTLIAIIGVIIFSKNNEKEENIDRIISTTGLPSISEINVNDSPILYDFVNSSIGYKSDINSKDFGFYYVIALNKEDKENVFIEYYSYGEKMTFPSLGTAPKKYSIEGLEESFKDFFTKIDKNRIYHEGDWTFIFVSQYNDNQMGQFDSCDAIGRWGGIDFIKAFETIEIGKMQKTIESGVGWPTDWLRKEPYLTTMILEGYDMNDPFWTKYNINSSKIYYTKSDEEIKVYVDQLNSFKLKYNGEWVYLKEDQLKVFLKEQGVDEYE